MMALVTYAKQVGEVWLPYGFYNTDSGVSPVGDVGKVLLKILLTDGKGGLLGLFIGVQCVLHTAEEDSIDLSLLTSAR